jgi:hypothetical protein
MDLVEQVMGNARAYVSVLCTERPGDGTSPNGHRARTAMPTRLHPADPLMLAAREGLCG